MILFIISESHDSPSHSEHTSHDLIGARLSGSIQTVLRRLALRLLRLTTIGAYFSNWSMFLRLTRNILLRLTRSILLWLTRRILLGSLRAYF